MKLKRLIALVLTLLISANMAVSNVFARDPMTSTTQQQGTNQNELVATTPLLNSVVDFQSPGGPDTTNVDLDEASDEGSDELERNGQFMKEPPTPTPRRDSPPEVREGINPTKEEIEALFREVLESPDSLKAEGNYELKLGLRDVVKTFSDNQCTDSIPERYKDVLDNYYKTDFYTVDSEEDNLEHSLMRFSEQLNALSESVSELSKNLEDCRRTLTDSTLQKRIFEEDAAYKFVCNNIQVVKIKSQLAEREEELAEFKKNVDIELGKLKTLGDMSSKHGSQKDPIYAGVSKIIKNQILKYEIQKKQLLTNISQTKKSIKRAETYASNVYSKANYFIKCNPYIMTIYRLKTELEREKEFLLGHIERMQRIYENKDKEQKEEVDKLKQEIARLQGKLKEYEDKDKEQREKIGSLEEKKQQLSQTPRISDGSTNKNLGIVSPIYKPIVDEFSSEGVDKNLVGKKIGDIFKDERFAKYVYKCVLCKDDEFKSDYLITNLDAHIIQKTNAIFLTTYEENITSFEGIEYFVNLKYFYYPNKSDREREPIECNLDLSKNTELEYLDISGNKLKDGKLDLADSLKLKELYCNGCAIEKLTLPESAPIVKMDLSSNKLRELVLSSLGDLQELNLANNELTSLKAAEGNAIIRLNIANNTGLGELDLNIFKNLVELDCSNTGRTKLSLELEKLEILQFQRNKIAEPDISSCVKLRNLICYSCSIDVLDLSSLPLLEVVDCSINSIKSLCVSSKNLKQFKFHTNPVTEVKVSEEVWENFDFDDRYTGKDMDGEADVYLIEQR